MVYQRITDTTRAAILDALRANDGRSRAAIAREHEVSPRTVTRIADAAGIPTAARWSTADTRKATESARDRMRAQRAQLAQRMLDEANACLDKLHGSFLVFNFGGKDNDYNEHLLDGPPTGDIRNLMTSAAVAIDKHVVLDRHDADQGADDAVSMLGQLADGLAAAHRQLAAPAATLDDQEDPE